MSLRLGMSAPIGRGNTFERALSRRAKVSLGIAAVVTASFPLAAFAEGSFNSSLSHVGYNFNTRTWTDKASDSTVTHDAVGGCQFFQGVNDIPNPRVNLKQKRTGPDTDYGNRKLSGCQQGFPNITVSWLNPGAGDFYDVIYLDDGDTMSASTFNVYY